jgi:hypothetical protein
MAVSFPFQPQFTWRKLGYLAFTDSLEYRAVIEQNPQWSVWELPPIGAQLRLTSASGIGGTAAGLTQGSFITGTLTGDFSDAIFPYQTQEEYNKALYRYTLQGVIDREELNGLTFDSTQAITGIQ